MFNCNILKTMNSYKLIYGIVFSILIVPSILLGQTYISPMLGIDGTAYGSRYSEYYGNIKYAVSPAYGLKIKQQLSKKLRIGLQGYFSQKFIPYKNSLFNEGNNSTFSPPYGVRMSNYNISVQMYYYPLKSFRIGIGPSILNVGDYQIKSSG